MNVKGYQELDMQAHGVLKTYLRKLQLLKQFIVLLLVFLLLKLCLQQIYVIFYLDYPKNILGGETI